jgi:hypothetical protein
LAENEAGEQSPSKMLASIVLPNKIQSQEKDK